MDIKAYDKLCHIGLRAKSAFG